MVKGTRDRLQMRRATHTRTKRIVIFTPSAASSLAAWFLSELIAGALQDQGRATIVGMKTFGKGSVQTWRELSNGGGVRITISLWFTPNGNSVNDVGITPDIEVPFDPEAAAQGEDNQLQAAIEVLQAMVENREPQIDVPLFGLDHDGSSQE